MLGEVKNNFTKIGELPETCNLLWPKAIFFFFHFFYLFNLKYEIILIPNYRSFFFFWIIQSIESTKMKNINQLNFSTRNISKSRTSTLFSRSWFVLFYRFPWIVSSIFVTIPFAPPSDVTSTANARTARVCASRVGTVSTARWKDAPVRVRTMVNVGWTVMASGSASAPMGGTERTAVCCSSRIVMTGRIMIKVGIVLVL